MTKDEYKNKLVWIEEIPKTWKIIPLWAFSKNKAVKSSNGELLSVYLERGVIRASDGNLGTHAPSLDLSNYQSIVPGDFILNNQQAWRGSVGVSFENGIISPAYIVLGLSQEFDPKYANYLLRSKIIVDQFMLASQGVGSIQRQVHAPSFKNVLVIIPSIEEQKTIADFLDEKTKIIDELVAKKEKLIELLREKSTALITHAVTKGLDLKAKMKPSGVDWLGDIPDGWNTDKISSLFGFPNEKVSDKDFEPLSITYSGVEKQVEDALRTDYGENRKFLKKGDIAFNGRSDRRGACGASEYTGSISVVYHVLRKISSYIFVRYYHHLFRNTLFSQEFYKWGRGIHNDMWTTRIMEMKRIHVPVPPFKIQKCIADFLDIETAKIDDAVMLIESQIEKLKEYRSSLIYSAVTGKIKV